MKINKDNLYFLILFAIIFGISIAYARMDRTLNITGNTEIKENAWLINFKDLKVKPGSVAPTSEPTINNEKDTIDFSVMLDLPGDFYEFSVDIVNEGTIDAMIDNIVKTPELTIDQEKYINYIIEYQNGLQVSNNQLVEQGSFVRLKVKVEYDKDITKQDLPETTHNLDLSISINYLQADEDGINIEGNGVISKNGSLDDIGTIVTLGTEKFYTIGTEGDTVKLLSMYNLHVGGDYNGDKRKIYENPTGIQRYDMIGYTGNHKEIRYGVEYYSKDYYWQEDNLTYPSYVFDERCIFYDKINEYKLYLEGLGISVNQVRLISYEELINLGCKTQGQTCISYAPEWVYDRSYFSGTAASDEEVYIIFSDGRFIRNEAYTLNGVRPVVEISKSLFN